MKLKALAAGLMLGIANLAMATPTPVYDFGTISQTSVISGVDVNGPFDHIFKFTLGPSFTGVVAGLVGIDAVGDLTAQYRFGVGSTAAWSGWSASAAVPSDNNTGVFSAGKTFSGLTAGQTYWAEFKGSATQASYSVTLAPVPEPENWAMMVAGLGLMGFVARRRKA